MSYSVEELRKIGKELRAVKQEKIKSLLTRDEQVKQIIVKACRSYLQENRYQWTEEQSQTTDSYYFHIIGDRISDWQSPVIRISNHQGKGKYRLAEFLLPDIGKHKPYKQIKKQVYRELSKGFKRLSLSSTKKSFEQLDVISTNKETVNQLGVRDGRK